MGRFSFYCGSYQVQKADPTGFVLVAFLELRYANRDGKGLFRNGSVLAGCVSWLRKHSKGAFFSMRLLVRLCVFSMGVVFLVCCFSFLPPSREYPDRDSAK